LSSVKSASYYKLTEEQNKVNIFLSHKWTSIEVCTTSWSVITDGH